jgi:hypothetical protein
MNSERQISDINKVPYYGKSFPFIPWTFVSKAKVSIVFAKTLYKKTGLLLFLNFWFLQLPFKTIKTLKKNKKGLRLMKKSFGSMAKLEWFLLIAIYHFLEKRNGKDKAYSFAKEAIQECSKFMMNDFYQAKELAKFKDPFEAFWEYHKAMFTDDPNYPNELIDERDCKIMMVHDCRNCEIAKLTIPELAPLGCDHDITGYKSIEKLTKMEFRRPQTLAKDGKPCKFMFFREGTAPQNIEIK